MKDYVIPNVVSKSNTILLNCPIDTQKYSFSRYSPPSTIFVCAVTKHTTIVEPQTYDQAKTNPHWVEAMNKELSALESNQTWTIVDTLPAGK